MAEHIDLPNAEFSSSLNFRAKENLQWIDIPEGVTSVANSGFNNITTLTKISFPDSLASIGNYAFEGCTSLEEVEFPESVVSIGNEAFRNCDSLKEVEIPASCVNIGSTAFGYCDALENVILPNTMTTIGSNAFAYNEKLKNVSLPKTCSTVNSGILRGCTSLESIVIPEEFPLVEYMFIDDSNLKSVNILTDSDTKRDIKSRMFMNCTSLNEDGISGTSKIERIGSYAFYNSGITVVDIGIYGQAIYFENGCFSNCANLVQADIPETVRSIGSSIFENCPNLKWLTVSSSMYNSSNRLVDRTQLSGALCRGCTSITSVSSRTGASVKIPDTITDTGSSTFARCTSLESVELPSGHSSDGSGTRELTTIQPSIFEDCVSLKTVKFNSEIITIGGYAFLRCRSLEELDLPSTVKTVNSSAFEGCTSLKNLSFGLELTSIGANAFSGCTSLETITIRGQEGDVSGAPWGAPSTCQIIWTGESREELLNG